MNAVERGFAEFGDCLLAPRFLSRLGVTQKLFEEIKLIIFGLLFPTYRSVPLFFAEQVLGSLGHGKQPGRIAFHFHDMIKVFQMRAETLCNQSGRVVFERKTSLRFRHSFAAPRRFLPRRLPHLRWPFQSAKPASITRLR